MRLKSFLIPIYSILFLTLFIVVGCKKPKDSAISVDDKQSLGTYYIDTFTATLSTVLVDSLPTSQNDKMLTGYYVDPKVGTFSAAPYFQFSLAGIDTDKDGREDILSYIDEPIFDSLILELNHVYSYGDTTSPHTMNVYRLAEDMKTVSGSANIYNRQAFELEAAPLATTPVAYTNFSGNKLRIRLQPTGQELFDLAEERDNRVANNAAFREYFKGLALIPDLSNKSIFGYSRAPTLTLYYRDSDNPNISKTYTFKHVANTDLFFNQMKNDRSSTALSGLTEIYKEISASQTNDESYVMTGVELMTKIKFPHLNDIREAYPNFAVNRAELIIQPKADSYSQLFRLPTDLVLYKTNTTNIPGAVITYTGTSIPEIINPFVDYESNRNTYYKFEVTDFIQEQLTTSFYNETALMLTSPRSYSGNRTEKLVLDSRISSSTVKLKLYLTIF
ncbi:MAG: hypothetical protein K0R51_1523 [Cytophagaceae bacterium]|jgi:hypothetical protein|nr:hypothetical protein [Cytophagaceae bacterium]